VILVLFVLTVLLSILAYKGAMLLFPKVGLLDFPERYGLTRERLPYPTGIVAVLLFLLISIPIIAQSDPQKVLIITVAVILLATTSLIDDRRTLPISLRLSVQIIIAILLFLSGAQIFTITHPFGGIISLDTIVFTLPVLGNVAVLSLFFTVLWLLFTMNALNWADGISGQVSTLSASGFFVLALLGAIRTHQEDIVLLSTILCAIAVATACTEGQKPKMILGDSGSMFFGLMLGLLAIYQGGKVATTFITFGIPLADALIVILKRILQRKSPFKGGRDHLHHQLVNAGMEVRTISFITGMIGLGSGVLALFLSTGGKFIAAGVIFLGVVAVHWVTRKSVVCRK
jgi:UDP-GlcNAc:undecaprenyl-phosphate GlcNAc-1-phosphate transferase